MFGKPPSKPTIFNRVKSVLKSLVDEAANPAVESDSHTNTPDPLAPRMYNVYRDKVWLVMHRGANRHERRGLDRQVQDFTPSERFATRQKLKDFITTTPSNFPIRRVIVNDLPRYVFEPEYWQLVAIYGQQNAERQAKAAEAIKTAAEAHNTARNAALNAHLPQHA